MTVTSCRSLVFAVISTLVTPFRGRRYSLLTLGLAACFGCDAGAFVCEDDPDCADSNRPGVCQASGYCSFVDDLCASGQRYGEFAGEGLAGTCVDVETSGGGARQSSGEGEDESGDGGDDSGDQGGPSDGSDGADTDGSNAETDGSDDGADGSDDGANDTDDGGSDPSDGGSDPYAGVECHFDDFSDGVLDPMWCSDLPPGIEISEAEDVLELSLQPEQWDGYEQFGHLLSCDDVPLLGIDVMVHIGEMPADPLTEGYFEVGNRLHRVGVAVYDSHIHAIQHDGSDYTYVSSLLFDPAAHQYWRVRGTDQGLVAEVSADGQIWVHLHTYELALGEQLGDARLAIWRGNAPIQEDSAEFDSIEVCYVTR